MAVGTHECGLCYEDNVEYCSFSWTSQSAECTIVIDTFGDVGEMIEGSFEATLFATGGHLGKVRIHGGRFRVMRVASEPK